MTTTDLRAEVVEFLSSIDRRKAIGMEWVIRLRNATAPPSLADRLERFRAWVDSHVGFDCLVGQVLEGLDCLMAGREWNVDANGVEWMPTESAP